MRKVSLAGVVGLPGWRGTSIESNLLLENLLSSYHHTYTSPIRIVGRYAGLMLAQSDMYINQLAKRERNSGSMEVSNTSRLPSCLPFFAWLDRSRPFLSLTFTWMGNYS